LERLYDHDQVREAARAIGRFMVERHPKLVTTELRLEKRPKKVYFDANMNGHGKTLAGAYSPRPVADGRVSYPLTWEELATAKPELYTIRTVPDLLAARGDQWANFLRDRQRLAK
jgi:bifunctional non-homologous end joining protein LigD